MRFSIPRTVALTVFFLSGCLFSSSIFAKTSSTSLPGSLRYTYLQYDNASGELGVSCFDGKSDTPAVNLWELLDGTRFSLNYLTYDDRGNLIKKVRYFSEGRVSTNSYQYDDNNNLIAEQFERSDSVSGTSDYIYEDGRLIRAEHHGLNGWLHANMDYHYNDLGQVSYAKLYGRSDSAGVVTFTYDEFGNQVDEIWYIGDWTQTFKREYEPVPDHPVSYASANPFIRNLQGIRLASENYDFSGKLKGYCVFNYDGDSNRLMSKRYIRSDSLETLTTCMYHPDGRVLRTHRKYPEGRSGFFRYDYDDSGRLIRKTLFTSDSTTSSEIFEYDKDGLLVAAEYENMDSWLTGKLVFVHDGKGRLKKGYFKGTNGVDAEIKFKTDKRGNPLKIHWKFTNGMTQTYEFKYEPASI